MPYKDELAQALSQRPNHDNDDNGNNDDDNEEKKPADDKKPKRVSVGGGQRKSADADSKSSFLALDYEEVILPDDAVSVDSDAPVKKGTPEVAKKKTAPVGKSPAAAPVEKAPMRGRAEDSVYAKVNKQRKTDFNNKAKQAGKITSIWRKRSFDQWRIDYGRDNDNREI